MSNEEIALELTKTFVRNYGEFTPKDEIWYAYQYFLEELDKKDWNTIFPKSH